MLEKQNRKTDLINYKHEITNCLTRNKETKCTKTFIFLMCSMFGKLVLLADCLQDVVRSGC